MPFRAGRRGALCASLGARAEPAGAGGLGQGQSRRAAIRFLRHGLLAAYLGGAAGLGGGDRDPAYPLSWQRPGDDRDGGHRDVDEEHRPPAPPEQVRIGQHPAEHEPDRGREAQHRPVDPELLDQVRSRGKMDIVSDIAFPLPAKVIAEMLGVPSEDWNIFQRWARGDGSDTASNRQEAARTMQVDMFSYFSNLLKERRRAPREDLISSLSVAEVDGERLSEPELISFCTLLLAAGQETTKNLITNAIVCLTDHRESMERLINEPALISTAIEEILRFLPPVWFLFRQTKSDVELAGQHIPANQVLLAWTASANRDPARFLEPDRFDIEREPNRHLAFGYGIHFCVGAPLARLEAKIALAMMLQQLKNLQRVEGVPIMVRAGIVFVIRSLPVTFQPY